MATYEHFLVMDRVCKAFPGEHGESATPVIDNVSMVIEEGEFIVYLGPSGCGKTTLMRTVGGLESVSSGAVILEGEPVTGPDRKKGMVFQSYSSFPWLTVLENVKFGVRYRTDVDEHQKDAIARHYLELVGLAQFADFYTNRISGGMRQRVAISRTLAANPDILLMDEPFGALDAQNRELLQAQLLNISYQEKKTVIFVTHDVEEAIFLADRIFVFSARPARVLREIRVAEHLGEGARTLETKESETFFRLRNEILHLTREQAKKTEELVAGEPGA